MTSPHVPYTGLDTLGYLKEKVSVSCQKGQRSKYPGHTGMEAAYTDANLFMTTTDKIQVLSNTLFHPTNT